MKKVAILLSIIFTIIYSPVNAKKIKALFIGNSYTDVNNLPEIIKQLALSSGDTLEYNKSTPGGYTFQQHSTNSTTLNLIQSAAWDYVILQEQSQLPSFPESQVTSSVYPYAKKLDSLVKVSNPCATTLFYMTWGRQNGDAQNCPNFPVLCTYEGMDSMLQLRYTIMADTNNAALAPVARVWRDLRANNPSIQLYSADESHPSEAGSFAAACTFYSIMFEKNPENAPFNFNVTANNAAIIKTTAKQIVFDSLSYWNRFLPNPISANFTFTQNINAINFTNNSLNADSYFWDFGDGNMSTDTNPNHSYNANGTYIVRLIAKENDCQHTSLFMDTVTVSGLTSIKGNGTAKNNILIYPNPTQNAIVINGLKGNESINIYDYSGRAILQLTSKSNSETVSLKNQNAGIYLISITHNNGEVSLHKIVKQ